MATNNSINNASTTLNSNALVYGLGQVDMVNSQILDSAGGVSVKWGARTLEIAGQTCLDYSDPTGIKVNGIKGNITANGSFNVATLVAGTVTVANTSITANSQILITSQAAITGSIYVTKTVGVGFDITSTNAGDAGDVFWFKCEIA